MGEKGVKPQNKCDEEEKKKQRNEAEKQAEAQQRE